MRPLRGRYQGVPAGTNEAHRRTVIDEPRERALVDIKPQPRDHKIVRRQGSKILHLRREQGLTQAQLSRGICTQAALSNYEHGIRQLPILVAMRIAGRLGVTVEDIAAA